MVTHHTRNEKRKPGITPRILSLSILTAMLALSGCSGTGTMYNPENDTSSFSGTSYTEQPAETAPETPDVSSRQSNPVPEREIPTTVMIEGTGSDLFSKETIDYYYHFTLEGTSFELPCSFRQLSKAGWELVLPESDSAGASSKTVRPYSYEFFDAVPSGSQKGGRFSNSKKQKKIRLCLANFSVDRRSPEDCTVCGISVSEDSGFSLLTSFNEGTGSSLKELTSKFGEDTSIYSKTSFKDGTRIVKYRFTNGLTEGIRIPVLAEAEEKWLAELMTAETAKDGDTIQNLSLYYFRAP